MVRNNVEVAYEEPPFARDVDANFEVLAVQPELLRVGQGLEGLPLEQVVRLKT